MIVLSKRLVLSDKLICLFIVLILAFYQDLSCNNRDSLYVLSPSDSTLIETMLDFFIASAVMEGDSACRKHVMYCNVLERFEPPAYLGSSPQAIRSTVDSLARVICRQWTGRSSAICEMYSLLRKERFRAIRLKDRDLRNRDYLLMRQHISDTRPVFRCCRKVIGATECEYAQFVDDFYLCKFTSILELLKLSCE